MSRFFRLIPGLLFLLVSPPWCLQALLRVSVLPSAPLFSLGSRSQLVCHVQGCSGSPSITWSPLDDRPLTASIDSNATHCAVTFDPVRREHEGALLCKASCGRDTRQIVSKVQVFALPSAPRVSGPVSVPVSVQSSLVCEVQDMYPPELLTLDWTEGDQLLNRTKADSGSTVVRSRLDFTPQRRGSGDQDLEFTCRAWMDLPQLSPDQRTRETRVQVQLVSPPTSVSLSASPEPALEGRGFTLTCQSDGAPPPTLVLSRNGAELRREDAAHFLSFSLPTAQLQDSAHYQCESTNQLGAARDGRNVSVRAHPLQVSVQQQVTAADSGSSLVLTCETQGCSRIPVLTWTKTGSAPDSVLHGTRDRSSSRLVLQDLDLQDSGVYNCEAQCERVTRRGHTQVQVYSFPSDPILSSPRPVVLGREAVFFCSVSGVSPAARLRLQWLVGNESVQTEGRFPHSETLQNITSELRLDQTRLRSLLHSQNLLQNQQNLLQSQQNQQGLSCRAEMLMEDGEVWRSRTTSTNLHIHSPPTNVSLSADPEPVLEGRGFTLACQSDGAPPPTLVLSRNGEELHREDSAHFLSFSLSSAQLQDSAHYQCESTNQHGAAGDGHNVTVRAPPRITSVLVLPSSVVFEGENITVCCSSVCAPPPSVYLTKLTNGTQRHSPDGTFLLFNVSEQDSGQYQVNVSNELGFEVHVFSIVVRERTTTCIFPSPSFSPILVCSLCVAVGLTSAALFLEYVRRARKKGSYQLTRSYPESSST
ncbi:vascular cell adhesion protein 1b [Eucyclogobius newberryi]|uniref:vascular cell adhesion protein 1b n=1 Tax=Eucyclogobius newberryi TaxID=166745 RepID=UPI003B5C653B